MVGFKSEFLWYKLWDEQWYDRYAIERAFAINEGFRVYEDEPRFLKWLWKRIQNGIILEVKSSLNFTNQELFELLKDGHKLMVIRTLQKRNGLTVSEVREIVDRWEANGKVC